MNIVTIMEEEIDKFLQQMDGKCTDYQTGNELSTIEGYLETVNDWDALVSLSRNTRVLTPKIELIDDRMVEILPELLRTIKDWNTLASMQRNTGSGTDPRGLIHIKMDEVLKTIGDWATLVSMFGNTEREPRKLVEQRMREVLRTIDDWNILAKMLKNTGADTKLEKLIHSRMTEILPALLKTINDWSILMDMLKDTREGSMPGKIIEIRMTEVWNNNLKYLTLDECPKYMYDIIKEKCEIPRFIDRDDFLKKLEEKEVEFILQ